MELNILASKSPRRKDLLNQIGFKFSVIQSNFVECLNTNLPPNALAETLALGKALKIAKNHRDNIIIGADTIVCHSNNTFGKPNNFLIGNFRITPFLACSREPLLVFDCFKYIFYF